MRVKYVAQLGIGVVAICALTAADSAYEPVNTAEVGRLRAHFATVLGELRGAEVSHLSASRRSARSMLIDRLEEYAAAGRFPHNHVEPGQFVPVFRDDHRTLCAMGYLIASTGRTDIVEDVVRNNNLAYIPHLAGDARLLRWLDSTGLTVAEAARIQPAYDGGICICPGGSVIAETRRTSAAYFVGSGAAMAVNAFSVIVNIAPRDASASRIKRNAMLGMVTGAGQLVLGAFALDEGRAGKTVGVANLAVGAAGLTSAIWRSRHIPQQPEPKIAARTVSIQPFVAPRSAGVVVEVGNWE
jgi:hypothetical protein